RGRLAGGEGMLEHGTREAVDLDDEEAARTRRRRGLKPRPARKRIDRELKPEDEAVQGHLLAMITRRLVGSAPTRQPATPRGPRLSDAPHPLLAIVRRFVDTDVIPVALALEHADEYRDALVARMRELGLFGALVPAEYGGLGLSVSVYARVIEEICRGWMSLAGVINSHTMAALIVLHHGTDEQRRRLLPRFAAG